MARKLDIEPTNDMQSRESITSSRSVSVGPLFFRCPTSAKTIIRFSQVFDKLAMVLKAAKLHMKQYMGEWRFLVRMTATTTKRFSARLTIPTVKKTGKGTFTSGQSVWFIAVLFIALAELNAEKLVNECLEKIKVKRNIKLSIKRINVSI